MVIYCIINKLNNKIYIGKSVRPVHIRWNKHLKSAESGSTLYIHNAIRKYGKESFLFEVVDSASSKDELSELEKYYISLTKSNNKEFGYNQTKGGDGGSNGMKGKKHSIETRQLMSNVHKKRKIHKNSIDALLAATERDRGRDRLSKEQRQELNQKNYRPVIDQFNNYFPSITHAANFYGFKKECISLVASGKRNSLFGIIFKYA